MNDDPSARTSNERLARLRELSCEIGIGADLTWLLDERDRLRAALEQIGLVTARRLPSDREGCVAFLVEIAKLVKPALSGESSAHETSDELEQLRHVYKAAWAYKNAKPGEETIEAYFNLDDALWDRKRAEFAENGGGD